MRRRRRPLTEIAGSPVPTVRGPWRQTRVTRIGDVIVKSGYTDVAVELEKAEALRRLAERQSFVVPRVIDASLEHGVIRFEYLPGLQSIRELYLAACRSRLRAAVAEEAFREAGRALACIHAELKLDGTATWQAPAALIEALRREGESTQLLSACGTEPVTLHGDYGFANVFVTGDDSRRIVVLDPSANGFTTFASNERGPRFVDLGNMVSCLQGLVPVRHYPSMDWSRAASLVESFLTGYESGARLRVPRAEICSMGRATASVYLEYRCRSKIERALARRLFYIASKGRLLHHE